MIDITKFIQSINTYLFLRRGLLLVLLVLALRTLLQSLQLLHHLVQLVLVVRARTLQRLALALVK